MMYYSNEVLNQDWIGVGKRVCQTCQPHGLASLLRRIFFPPFSWLLNLKKTRKQTLFKCITSNPAHTEQDNFWVKWAAPRQCGHDVQWQVSSCWFNQVTAPSPRAWACAACSCRVGQDALATTLGEIWGSQGLWKSIPLCCDMGPTLSCFDKMWNFTFCAASVVVASPVCSWVRSVYMWLKDFRLISILTFVQCICECLHNRMGPVLKLHLLIFFKVHKNIWIFQRHALTQLPGVQCLRTWSDFYVTAATIKNLQGQGQACLLLVSCAVLYSATGSHHPIICQAARGGVALVAPRAGFGERAGLWVWVISSASVRRKLSQGGVGQQRLLVDERGLWLLSSARTCEGCDRFGMQKASHHPKLFIISSQLSRVPRFCRWWTKRREMEQGSS